MKLTIITMALAIVSRFGVYGAPVLDLEPEGLELDIRSTDNAAGNATINEIQGKWYFEAHKEPPDYKSSFHRCHSDHVDQYNGMASDHVACTQLDTITNCISARVEGYHKCQYRFASSSDCYYNTVHTLYASDTKTRGLPVKHAGWYSVICYV